jgi:ferrous iron transport protein B
MACHNSPPQEKKHSNNLGKHLTFALAGNANVGKSVIFNQLTGSSQIIGNWPGKTVERAEGKLSFEGYDITVVDLPGIYSLSTFSQEELVSREYIAFEKPDVVINVLDASVLERNLFFTLQLKEMQVPLIVCLNQADVAEKKGIDISLHRLSDALGAPVVRTIAVRGEGLHDLVKTAVEVALHGNGVGRPPLRYGHEVEKRIRKLAGVLQSQRLDSQYPARWLAIKLLENDSQITENIESKSKEIIRASHSLAEQISRIHGEPSFAVIASERYSLAHRIARDAYKWTGGGATFSERIDRLATHRVFGYVTSAAVIAGLLLWTFMLGGLLSNALAGLLSLLGPVNLIVNGSMLEIVWNGVFGGIVAGLTLVIPFVVPFYLLLAVIEDSGILTRIAFMMDSAMHKIGLHGKALIPLILGYGCSVPAIRACRIMETQRERLLAALAITFAPCAARTIVILGLVAVFVSPVWALVLYAADIAIIFMIGRIALRIVPGKSTGLIMEMHSLRLPSLEVVLKQTWTRTKSIIYIVFPIYIVGSVSIQLLYRLGTIQQLSNLVTPVTVFWLGLPAIGGVLLMLGLVRKEFILLALVAIYGSANLTLYVTPAQLITLALVGMIYVPCLSTIVVLAKEFGWKHAIAITAANLATAILFGGIASRLLILVV